MKTRLSVCIPVYNFGKYIGATLESIISQIEPGVEIVVLDGGSTDNTPEAVSRYQKGCPALIYYRQDFKGGIDKDMARAVELAQGEYCWLLSGDDLLKPGSLKRVLAEIASGNDVYLCNRTECDINMNPFRDRYSLRREVRDRVFNLHEAGDLARYLGSSLTITALFSYMSSIIFKKGRGEEAPEKESFYGTCYAHSYRMLSFLINHDSTLKYISQPLVFCRIGNDSFADGGFVKRVTIDFEGYSRIRDRLFSNEQTRGLFNRVLRKEYTLSRLAKIRAVAGRGEWRQVIPRLRDIGYGPVAITICGSALPFRPMINGLVRLKQEAGKYLYGFSNLNLFAR